MNAGISHVVDTADVAVAAAACCHLPPHQIITSSITTNISSCCILLSIHRYFHTTNLRCSTGNIHATYSSEFDGSLLFASLLPGRIRSTSMTFQSARCRLIISSCDNMFSIF